MEWQAWLEYKHEEVERRCLRLREVEASRGSAAGPRATARPERPASWA